MVERVLEGTWEEIAAHAGELAGRRVRVEVLNGADAGQTGNGETPPSFEGKSLAEVLEGRIGVIQSTGGKGGGIISQKTGEDFAREITAKDSPASLTLADWMEGYIGVVEGSGESVADRSEEVFAEGIEARYRGGTGDHDPV
jgi:hypothetical protein